MLHPQTTLNCAGQLLVLDQPLVMGILNSTPDSFYDGGRYNQVQTAVHQADRMLLAGASIIDIGGMSSRPGAKIISTKTEIERVLPVIAAIKQAFPKAILSIDTVHAEVARAAVETGASMINDISAGRIDAQMYATVAKLQVPYVLMHMQGKPRTMQQQIEYKDVVETVLDFLIQEVGKLRVLGVHDIILDVGFGFGKTIAHNYQLLQKMHVFQILDLPVLAGISRKSMIYKVLDSTPKNALNGTSALHIVALQQGAKILRAHDVQAAVEVIKLWQQLENVGEK